jgi:hypothetical protein
MEKELLGGLNTRPTKSSLEARDYVSGDFELRSVDDTSVNASGDEIEQDGSPDALGARSGVDLPLCADDDRAGIEGGRDADSTERQS